MFLWGNDGQIWAVLWEKCSDKKKASTRLAFLNPRILDSIALHCLAGNIPQLLAHLKLSLAQKRKAYEVLMEWSETDKSKIVGYYSLQTAANFAEADDKLLRDFIPRLKKLNKTGAKSIQNRCKKIAKQLGFVL